MKRRRGCGCGLVGAQLRIPQPRQHTNLLTQSAFRAAHRPNPWTTKLKHGLCCRLRASIRPDSDPVFWSCITRLRRTSVPDQCPKQSPKRSGCYCAVPVPARHSPSLQNLLQRDSLQPQNWRDRPPGRSLIVSPALITGDVVRCRSSASFSAVHACVAMHPAEYNRSCLQRLP